MEGNLSYPPLSLDRRVLNAVQSPIRAAPREKVLMAAGLVDDAIL